MLGQTISHYRIVEKLGGGGMGVVYSIGERAKLQIIWEAFNVLNHANITGVNNVQYTVSGFSSDCGIAPSPCLVPQNQGLSAFGTPIFSSGARIMQLAARVTF